MTDTNEEAETQRTSQARSRSMSGSLAMALKQAAQAREQAKTKNPDYLEDGSSTSNRGVSTVVLHPATRDQILGQLARLDAAFPSAAMTQHDRAVRFEVFRQELQGYTVDAVRAAVDTYMRAPPAKKGEKKFFPEPHELIAECQEHQRLVVLRERGMAKPVKAGPM